MSGESPPGGTEPGEEQSFLSHLTSFASGWCARRSPSSSCSWRVSPFMREIFAILSAPLMSVLPEGTKLIATGVITPFMVPLKLTLFVSFLIALPTFFTRRGRSSPRGMYLHENALPRDHRLSVAMFGLGMNLLLLRRLRPGVPLIASFAPSSVNVAPTSTPTSASCLACSSRSA